PGSDQRLPSLARNREHRDSSARPRLRALDQVLHNTGARVTLAGQLRASLKGENKVKSILLVDLSSIFFGVWHASAHEEQNAAFNITKKKCQEVMAWRNGDGYDAIAWCVDTPPYQRAQIRSDYKANREKRDPKAFDQYLRIQQWLKAQGELVWGAKGFEADDIMATACAQAPDDVDAIDIHTGDKDLLQLVDDRVQILPIRTD